MADWVECPFLYPCVEPETPYGAVSGSTQGGRTGRASAGFLPIFAKNELIYSAHSLAGMFKLLVLFLNLITVAEVSFGGNFLMPCQNV